MGGEVRRKEKGTSLTRSVFPPSRREYTALIAAREGKEREVLYMRGRA